MKNFLTLILTGLTVAGCAITPTFPRVDENKGARIKVIGEGKLSLIQRFKDYKLTSEGDGEYIVPAGIRVAIKNSFEEGGGSPSPYVHTYIKCAPALSFIPEAGAHYIVSSQLVTSGTCRIYLFKLNPNSPTGIEFEPSVDHAYFNMPSD